MAKYYSNFFTAVALELLCTKTLVTISWINCVHSIKVYISQTGVLGNIKVIEENKCIKKSSPVPFHSLYIFSFK